MVTISGVILAGGQGRRFNGQDKGLVSFRGKPIIEHLLPMLQMQLGQNASLFINANRNLEQYKAYNYPVISDSLADYQGPLAGFAIAMQTAPTDYIITLPCDAPFVSPHYVERLSAAITQAHADIAVAFDGQRLQPVHVMLSTTLLDSLESFLAQGNRKIDLWFEQHKTIQVDFSDHAYMFKNMNTPEQHQALEAQGETYAL